MKKLRWIIFAALLLLGGCYCRHCAHGETVAAYPVNDDLVVDATEYAEFRRTVLEAANNNLDSLPEILFRIATNAEIPAGTVTVAINNAQLNRWFSPTNKGSFLNRIYWSVAQSMLKKRRIAEDPTVERALELAPIIIKDATKRARFQRRIHDLQDPTIEEY